MRGKSTGFAGGSIFKKPLDIPKSVGYVVNNFDAKYVDILSASGYANGVHPAADFHFIKRF